MKRLFLLLLFPLSCFATPGNGPYPSGGGSGGGTVNNYVITNNAIGAMAGYGGGFTAAPIGGTPTAATATNYFPLSGPVNIPGSLTNDSFPILPGTYTNWGVYVPTCPGLGGTTNLTFALFTNNVYCRVEAIVSSNVLNTNIATSLTIGTNTLVCVVVTNNQTASLAIGLCTAYWSLAQQVPTSVVGVSATVTNINPSTNIIIQVYQNGFSIPGGFQSVSGAGASLQAALNYTTNFGGGIYKVDNSDVHNLVYFTSNNYGAELILQPGAVYYQHGGFTIPNNWASGSIWISGQSYPGACIMGDSNVLWDAAVTNNNNENQMPYFQIDHCTLCWSNYPSKGIALNLIGNVRSVIDNNLFIAYDMWAYTNWWTGWDGGGPPSGGVTSVQAPGEICGVVNGGEFYNEIRGNYFDGAAAGFVLANEHVRVENNLFEIANQNVNGNTYTNQWATNDTTIYDNDSFQGYWIATGAGFIVAGGDTVLKDDKWQGGSCGIAVLGTGGSLYGPLLLENEHFETTGNNPSEDLLFLNWTGFDPPVGRVVAENCFDEQTGDNGIQVYSQNSTYQAIVTSITDSNKLVDIGSYTNSFKVKINNATIFALYTNVPQNGQVLEWTNGMAQWVTPNANVLP